MKRMLKYFKGYKKECVLGPLFKLFEATLELIVPLVISALIDYGIYGKENPFGIENSRSFAIYACLSLVLLGAVGLAFSATAQYFAAKASVGYVTKMRKSLFSHIQTLSYSELDTLGTSTLITRMTSDANQVQTGLNLALRLLLRSPFVVFGAMIMAFTVDFRASVSFIAVIPALSVVVFGIMLVSIPLHKKVQSRLDGVMKKTRENLSGVRVIRAFCKEDEEISEFKEKNDTLSSMQRFVGRISALMNPLTYVLINLAIVWLIYSGALRVDSGNLTQGEVVALYNYMSQILVELVKLASLIITITKALASAGRISSVFDVTSSVSYGECALGNQEADAVEFKDVTLEYKNAGAPTLTSLSFKVKRGSTVGIIGGTGAGKSSLINLIPRFYDATSGEVLIDGVNVCEYEKGALTKKVGVVPQRAVLFAGSIRDNMRLGNPDATDEDIVRAIKLAEGEDVLIDKGGLNFMIEEGGRNLSGGQKQRLTIARALVTNPDILILDDSASALDFATDARLRASLRGLLGEKTVFIVSQRTSSIMHADNILVLDDGEISAMGTHEELLKSSPVYREIYDSQFKKEVE